VGEVIIQPAEVEFLAQGARNLAIEARQQRVDGGALRGGSGRLRRGADAAKGPGLGRGIDRGRAEAGRHGVITPRYIRVDEVDQLVPLDRPAERATDLLALLGGNVCTERIARVEPRAAVEPVDRKSTRLNSSH